MSIPSNQIAERSFELLQKWLEETTRTRQPSRNTVAVGIVVLDHLRQECPVSREDVITPGGEVRGSRGKGFRQLLDKYRIDRTYLKEVTTRQAPQDAQNLFEYFDWGELLEDLPKEERDALLKDLIEYLAEIAREWLRRQSLQLDIDRGHAPSAWIRLILENAKGRSGGVVEQHLVGAKLERRFPDVPVPNHPAHAADVQTERLGDFAIHNTVYHVTGTPSSEVIQKCAQNVKTGRHPVLLVPRDQELKAIALAEDRGVAEQLSIVSIEDFLALNIIELSTGRKAEFFRVLQQIIEIYNRRLEEVETDLSLQIEVK